MRTSSSVVGSSKGMRERLGAVMAMAIKRREREYIFRE